MQNYVRIMRVGLAYLGRQFVFVRCNVRVKY